MRVVLGIVAMAFGIVGFLAGVIADVQTWRITGRVADTARRGTERADQGLQNVEGALTRVESTVTVTTVALADARRRIEAIDEKNEPDNAKLQRVLEEVKPYLERVNAVADVIASLAVLLENTAVLLEQGDDPPRVDGLRTAAADLNSAGGELHAVTAEFDKYVRAVQLLTPRTLIALIVRSQAAVLLVQTAVEAVREYIGSARQEVQHARQRIDFWAWVIPVAVTAVLVWIGLGQLCLAAWGRRLLAGRA